ncbi:MAG TPA: hypothetical protein VMV44_02340 [Rectinemataceae bacterium]|nr:hypothetical protein [Rectinemataceae bacterium]
MRLRHLSATIALALSALAGLPAIFASCLPDPAASLPNAFDLKPPALIEAGPEGPSSFVLRFDEEVSPVEGSFAVDPGGDSMAVAEGRDIRVELPAHQLPGKSYSLVGDVRDGGGNGSRVILSFTGYNDHPARLRISEVQTAKNSSTTRPHRDFVEFEVTKAGNLGGMEFSASSSVKTVTWRFPGVEVSAGAFVVLHCAPEGLPVEIDETGAELLASGGVDSSPARDFWSKAGGIPDATGLLALREAPGGKAIDALFYSDGTKTGVLGESLVGDLVEELLDFELWEAAGSPSWEDAFVWKPSVSRSIIRLAPDTGPGAVEWGLSTSSGQSPGAAN